MGRLSLSVGWQNDPEWELKIVSFNPLFKHIYFQNLYIYNKVTAVGLDRKHELI